MTKEAFEFAKAMVLAGLKNEQEIARVKAVTFEQALQNERDGLPAFGFDVSFSAEEKAAVEREMIELAKLSSGTIH